MDAHADVQATDDTLVITLTSTPENRQRFEDVIERHLVKFGEKDGLQMTWSAPQEAPEGGSAN